MSPASDRAWRFVHPDLGTDPEEPRDVGFRLTPQGGVEMVEGARAVRQSIFLLLSTRPGERVMRPSYGCDLHRLAFASADATTAGLAIHAVRRAIERWEPRAEILDLDASVRGADAARLEIDLEYRVRSTGEVDRLVYAYRLSGETG